MASQEHGNEDRLKRYQLVALVVILLVLAVVLWFAYSPAGWVPASRLSPGPAPQPQMPGRGWLVGLTVGPTTPLLLLAAVAALATVAVREARREERNEDAPRVLAVLLALYALLLMTVSVFADPWYVRPVAAAQAGLPPPSLYYVVVGLLWLASATYLYFGRRAARAWYGLALAVAWYWSYLEFGVVRQFWMQVGMPSLIGLYIFSWRVSGRLAPAR
jgi:hypothetical protein